MVLTFDKYQFLGEFDYNSLGQIDESHQYSDAICSVMDKLTFYVKRNASLENSKLNESAKRAYNKDIHFNRNEKIAVGCIFNEMLNQYEENMKDELSLYESIINQGSLLEEGIEYDCDSLFEALSLDEGLKDKFKALFQKGKDGLKNATKDVLDNTKDIAVKSVEVIKAKKDDLVDWAKQAKKEFEEKYAALKELIEKIVKKGVDTITAFIDNLLEVFTSIGDNLVDAVKKLGGLKMDKDEKPASIDIEDADGIYTNAKSDEEKSFINNIILRAEAILSKDKDNAAKLMTESYLEESIVDNKFIAWLAGYKSDGTKMSWWKCILIGLCASLIVWLLPKVLVFAGLGGALAAFIAALVGVVWNGVGLLKLIYRRNKERKSGEKFFDKKTAIFFGLSILSMTFSVATFLKTVGPLMREICNSMGWTEGADMGKFGELVYNFTKKISPKDCFSPDQVNTISEQANNNFGGDFRGNDLLKSKDDMIGAMDKMEGASDANKTAFGEFLDKLNNAKGTKGVYDAAATMKDSQDLPLTYLLDTSKWGNSGPIIKAINQLKDAGQIPDTAIIGTAGSVATQAASGGQYGFCTLLTGLSDEQAKLVLDTACKIAGKTADTLHMTSYGAGAISDVISHVETIKGAFDVLTPNIPFLPMVMPFFDEKKWGKYKMRFASSTRGAASYVVDKVEMLPADKIEEDSPALDTLKKMHNNAWEDFKKENPELVEESVIDEKKEKKKKKVEEPQYIVFHILKEESDKKEDNPDKKENEEKEGTIGVVIDTLTMMVADVCNFNKSAEIRRRPQPYFMKGLLSRLSFRPVESNDNETKDYIRTTLGQTMKTLILQNVLYGTGRKYIDSKVDGDKAEYTLRETVLGGDKKINPDKVVFELGNFTPNELIKCLTDDSKNNKIAYEFLDGEYATKISIKKDANGNITSTKAIKDDSSIENVKYYRVKKETYKEVMDEYDKKVEKWKKKKEGKRPVKPQFIKGDDGEYYKRASKKFLADPANKRKSVYDFVDIRIKPLLKKGELYKKLVANDKFKKVLYKEDEENNVKLNKEVLKVLKPFLYRPEKTFAKDDEHQLEAILKEQGVEGEKLGWFKNLFKDEEQIHDTFKELIEIIWDYLSDNRRKIFKKKDFKPNHGKANEEIKYSFDELVEEFYDEEFDDDTEYEYDIRILNEQKSVLSYEDYLIENEKSED